MATVITNAGKAIVANRILGSGTEPAYGGWGTGAGTAAAADTTLFTESADEARDAATTSRVTVTVTNDTYQAVTEQVCASSGKTITNSGLFDASSAGNLFIHTDFTGVVLAVGDSIESTYKITFA